VVHRVDLEFVVRSKHHARLEWLHPLRCRGSASTHERRDSDQRDSGDSTTRVAYQSKFPWKYSEFPVTAGVEYRW
jgi:hypothetical protein